MKTKLSIVFLSIAILCIKSLWAQNELQPIVDSKQKHGINVCAVAIPVMNFYVLNYEYLHKNRHGLATRIEYAPNLKGAETKGDALSVVFNYRWHFSPELNGFFTGPYIRYRYVLGSGTANETGYDFKLPNANLGLNGGYRWVSKIGLNVVFAFGYGYSFGKEKLSPSNSETKASFEAFKNAENKNYLIIDSPFYAEFSIGYAF